jgi:hypothetical protein
MPRCNLLMTALLLVAACGEEAPTAPTAPSNVDLPAPSARASDPTATWTIPAPDGVLGLSSDGQGAYANGVCGVSAKLFATTAGSNSGDATIQTAKGKNCTRRFTLRYPDGATESVLSFNNLLQLQNTTYSIPVGSTAKRRLILNPGAIASNPSRCGRLLFGPNGLVGVGSDSVNVTRTSASSWQVQSAGSNLAYCEANGALYAMPVSFTVTSSVPLP